MHAESVSSLPRTSSLKSHSEHWNGFLPRDSQMKKYPQFQFGFFLYINIFFSFSCNFNASLYFVLHVINVINVLSYCKYVEPKIQALILGDFGCFSTYATAIKIIKNLKYAIYFINYIVWGTFWAIILKNNHRTFCTMAIHNWSVV